MPRRYGPPIPRHPTGPNCEGCPYRATSFGYAPVSGDAKKSTILFLLEALGADEVEEGRNAVGATGKVFNLLLHENTPILRSEQTVANCVRCRPVEWEDCPHPEALEDDPNIPFTRDECPLCLGKGQRPSTRDWNNDHINATPSAGQIRECWSRYGKDLLEEFNGKYIMTLGKSPLRAMTGQNYAITKYRGTIFEPGELIECITCNGSGKIAGRTAKCKECKGHGKLQCGECKRWTKHLKKCPNWKADLWFVCLVCKETGTVPGKPKNCIECKGGGRVSKNPDNPFVCDQLKSHQLLFPTYHPALLMHEPTQWPVVERDFSRLPRLEEELRIAETTRYHQFPPVSATRDLLACDSPSIDIETSDAIIPSEGDIVCIGATHESGTGYTFDPDDPRIRELLCKRRIIGQNFVLYDDWWLYNKGYYIPDETLIFDTRYAGKLCNPDTPNDLVYLTSEFAVPPIRGYWKTTQNYRNRKDLVAGIDVDATKRVELGQIDRLERNGQLGLMNDYIMPLSKITIKMRRAGMKINKEKMEHAGRVIQESLVEERALLPQWGGTGTENQHAKVQAHLYDSLRLPVQKKRGTGKSTGNAEALEELTSRLETGHRSINHLAEGQIDASLQFIKRVLSLRDMSKLESSFLRYRISPTDFVHPALSLGGSPRGKHESGRGTASFRFSCVDPNAQQVPDCKCPLDPVWVAQYGRTKCYGTNPACKGARYIFIPDHDDWEVMSVDLSQAEVVGFLFLAEEWTVLEKVLKEGLDAHQSVANQVLGRDASKAERDTFKTTTFAILFGEHERTTAARLHLPVEDIQEARVEYYKMLPGVDDYRSGVISSCKRRGYVESPFGFRRYIRLDKSTGRAANQACNQPIQNIPPTVIGKGMLKLDRQLPPPARLWMQVHDELVVVYPKHLREQVRDCMVENLRDPVPELSAPTLGMAGGIRFNVDVEVGPHWGALRKYDEVVALEKEGKNPWMPA